MPKARRSGRSRVIRISDQTWAQLKKWGEPFETPDQALRRLLNAKATSEMHVRAQSNSDLIQQGLTPVAEAETEADADAEGTALGGHFLKVAYRILKQAGEPLNASEITERALDKGMLHTRGKTPHATMYARLYFDTQHAPSRFRRVASLDGGASKWAVRA